MYDVEDCVIGDAVYLLVLVFYLDMDCVGLLVVVGIAARMDAALCSLKVAAQLCLRPITVAEAAPPVEVKLEEVALFGTIAMGFAITGLYLL